MGCSNPHPHSQVWSTSILPTLPTKELRNLRDYAQSSAATTNGPNGYQNKPCLLCEYVTFERTAKERIVVENEHFVALVPWWAYWPFETLGKYLRFPRFESSHCCVSVIIQEAYTFLIPFYPRRDPGIRRDYIPSHDSLRQYLFLLLRICHGHPPASATAQACRRSAGGGRGRCCPFPRPFRASVAEERDSAQVFGWVRCLTVCPKWWLMVTGRYEVMAEPQRDLTAEQAAQRLRACASLHYTHKQ